VIPNRPPMEWSVFPTDGTRLKTKMGRHVVEKAGHWEASQLILRETGPGNAPWRRSTEERILSRSSAGRLSVKVHHLSDTRREHDSSIEWEKVRGGWRAP